VNGGKVIAVGAPPTFRNQVARALEQPPEEIEWMPTVSAAESIVGDQGSVTSVVVLSPSVKEVEAFAFADFVGSTSPATAVLLLRDQPMNGLLPAAMRAGVRDVVDMSKGGEELRESLKRAIVWSDNLRSIREASDSGPELRGKVISVFSSKGGTGKTFLTTNLASALAKGSGKDTAVLDLELELGDVFSYFGTEPTRPLADLVGLGEDAKREDLIEVGTELAPNLYGFGSQHSPGGGTVITGESIGKVVRALRRSFDYVVVDGTAQYTDPVLAAFDLSDVVCLIAALDVVGIRHLSLALQTFLSLGFPRDRFRVILNRADSKVALDVSDVERVVKVKADVMIPSSRLVPTSLNLGKPVVLAEPRSEVAKAVIAFAQSFIGSPDAEVRRGMFSRRGTHRANGRG
jgi:pilus assembly protein CpaE